MTSPEKAIDDNFLPQCFEGFSVQTAQGKSIDIAPESISALFKGACLGKKLKLGEEAEQFVCPLGQVTVEQAAHPETLEDASPLIALGPTCREFIMGAYQAGDTVLEDQHA